MIGSCINLELLCHLSSERSLGEHSLNCVANNLVRMLFLHLFNGQHTDLCTNLFYVGDVPLALWLTWACNPVSFFLLLSGYGLACKYEKGSLSPRNQSSRIFNLYLHYWIVLAIFLVIGHLLYPSRYPGSLSTLIANVTGWNTDYCSENRSVEH